MPASRRWWTSGPSALADTGVLGLFFFFIIFLNDHLIISRLNVNYKYNRSCYVLQIFYVNHDLILLNM